MTIWPTSPVIYEINTWVWLHELSLKQGQPVTLGTVPRQEWDSIAELRVDAVWLMGVWERSPAGIGIAMRNEGLLEDFRRALPDFSESDNVGSPYCVRRYVVDENLGGPAGLAVARKMLAERGILLILDFVPNHVAPDHPWVAEHPEYFVQGDAEDLRRDPASFYGIAGKVIARGRDPHFPAWPDVLQLNAFHRGLRQAVIETVSSIADQCDGVRCDMAMLVMNKIFSWTWGDRAGDQPEADYWPEIITAVHLSHGGFLFMAEAYWDLEWDLQQEGFDYCYDKRLYDRLEHENAESVRLHLLAGISYQGRLVRFLENHDEPRAAAVFSPDKERAAAITIATLPGARLFHEGQFEGRRVKLPVFLRRRPAESVDDELKGFYHRLLSVIGSEGLRSGEWRLCERTGWHDNQSFLNIVAWCWRRIDERCLVVVNLSDSRSQSSVRLSWDDLEGRVWQISDAFTGTVYERSGDELCRNGLYVDLPPWGYHVLRWPAG